MSNVHQTDMYGRNPFRGPPAPSLRPKQTGCMHRPIDTCSDLYSFGVTFYEMLMGELNPIAGAMMLIGTPLSANF